MDQHVGGGEERFEPLCALGRPDVDDDAALAPVPRADPVRVAPITLREIRLGQLSVDNVSGAVVENLETSLLGMSFLKRLQSYEMRDGVLTISW